MNKKEIETIKKIFKISESAEIIPIFIVKISDFHITYYKKEKESNLFELDKGIESSDEDNFKLLNNILEKNFIKLKYVNMWLLKDLSNLNVSLDLENKTLKAFPYNCDDLSLKFTIHYLDEEKKFLKEIIVNKELKLFIELNCD